ncbi:MAG: hypothetical protein JNL13_11760, partial [Chitinophagaceae bacterium]|nr:hypothetical protein [Chitinophagaceae bacterium]
MNHYYQLQKFLIGLFLVLLYCAPARANHLAAADMHVDYVPTGATPYSYRVTLNVYKACEGGIPLGLTARLEWESISGCLPGGFRDMGPVTIDTLDKLCDTFKAISSCRPDTGVTDYPAFIRHTWVLVVDLPGPCPDWVFSWRQSARNNIIRNIGPGNLYVDAMINNSKKARVNTPRYSIDPIPYVCLNSRVAFPNAPIDPDYDSMVSANMNPRFDGPTPYNYANYITDISDPTLTYTLTSPIASDPSYPYTLDPNTATATFQPTVAGRFVLAFQTYDYDRVTRELMGFTTRDVQVAVLGCVAPPPDVDTPKNPVGGYIDTVTRTVYACPGTEISFDAGAKSRAVLIAKVFARWDLGGLTGATYTTEGDGTSHVVGRFYWTPGKGDVGTHIVRLRFADSTCTNGLPLVQETYHVIKIVVLPAVNGGKDGKYCIPGGAPWQMQTVIEPGMRYKWSSIAGSPT